MGTNSELGGDDDAVGRAFDTGAAASVATCCLGLSAGETGWEAPERGARRGAGGVPAAES